MSFTARFKENWLESGRHFTRFESKCKDWLVATVRFKTYEIEVAQQRGRPSLPFKKCSNSLKRPKPKNLTRVPHWMNLPMLHK